MYSLSKKFSASVATVLILATAPAASADPADRFPSGPYNATLISEKILYPSLFGVEAGLPVADVSGVLLSDGTIRAYVFAQNQGIVIADSTDGKSFTKVANAFGGDKGQGMPRVVKLSDGRYRMYNMASGGISCSISTDGLSFTVEKSECISSSPYVGASNGLTGAAIVKLANGSYRAYFSDMVRAGTGPDPHQVYSATSTDGLNWSADTGIRVGPGAPSITRSAEHPAAAVHSDGSVTLFYFDNGARPGKDSSGRQNMANGQMGLWYSTSTDGGITFSGENKINFPAPLSPGFGNDPDVFLDKSGSMILWAGGFEQALGGYIGAVKLTKGSPNSPQTGAPMGPPQKSKNIKFTCAKGKQKVTKTGMPVCPPGWKLLK